MMSRRKNLLETANESEILKVKRPHKKGRMPVVILDRRETLQHRGVLWGKLRYSWSGWNIGERGNTSSSVLRRQHEFNCNDSEKMRVKEIKSG
jgi:hypothetical protein